MDLIEGTWSTESAKGKKLKTVVPLPKQAIRILTDLQAMSGHYECVFPSPRSKDGSRPISENAVLVAMRSLGWGA